VTVAFCAAAGGLVLVQSRSIDSAQIELGLQVFEVEREVEDFLVQGHRHDSSAGTRQACDASRSERRDRREAGLRMRRRCVPSGFEVFCCSVIDVLRVGCFSEKYADRSSESIVLPYCCTCQSQSGSQKMHEREYSLYGTIETLLAIGSSEISPAGSSQRAKKTVKIRPMLSSSG